MIKCTYCGKFIPYFDLDSGKATSKFSPDTEFDAEEIIFLCARCNLEEYLKKAAKEVSTWPEWKRGI